MERNTTCANFAHMGSDGDQQYVTTLYNLDVIISVGYRVKSQRGTQFRIWANKILKQYLLQGYAVNERLAAQKYDELSQLVKVLGRTIQNQERLTEDSRSLLDVVVDYTYALDTLDRYDYQELKIEKTTGKESFHATYENAMEVIHDLHKKFGGSTLFGNEKDDSFKSSIGQIYQTFIKFDPKGESRLEYARLRNTLLLGKGESACMVYCRDNKDVLGSSNLKDIKEYCANNQITYLTTIDFLYYALMRKKITKAEVDVFIADVIAKGSKLPSVNIENYLPTSNL